MDATDFFQFWRIRIQRDLAPFVDPGTRLQVDGDGRSLLASWKARGVEHEAEFSIALDAGVRVFYHGQEHTYRAFLAAPEMADLRNLAKMILQSDVDKMFVPTRARLADDSDGGSEQSAVELLQHVLTRDAEIGATRIVMVTGEAGAGKTHVLQELVRQQADRYIRGGTDLLYLYVNAQGRALARFNEALATELQDLRAAVTYHAVATLVRNGILIPIIDGFDELLGVGGFEDAFSSLALFMEELDGEGQIVASARSTYYEQEFLSRANRVSSLGGQYWVQVPVEVLSWGEAEFDDYLERYANNLSLDFDAASTFKEAVSRVFAGPNEQFRLKPLFVARTVDLVAAGVNLTGESDLLDQLVAAFLERERTEKLLNRTGDSLLTAPQLSCLLTTLAEEMWNQETRELDRISVREIAEYVLVTMGVSDTEQRVVIERMPTTAFLMPGESAGSLTFEHEMFFSYFLASAFGDALRSQTASISILLGRSVLPQEVAKSTSRILRPIIAEQGPQPMLTRLGAAAAKEGTRATQIRENAGRIAGMLLHDASIAGGLLRDLNVRSITFPGGELADVRISHSVFEDVSFRRTDLSRASFVECTMRNCFFFEILVDPETTRLEGIGIDPDTQVAGLRIADGSLIKLVFDPVEIRKALIRIKTLPTDANPSVGVRAVDHEIVQLLERLMRAYNRTNPVCTADDNLRNLFRDPKWPELQRALVEFHVVSLEQRGTGGPPKDFLRRQFLPQQIMAGRTRDASIPSDIRAFWEFLEQTYPQSD
ncbi:MAG TPA: NACHT domain-containing protein [Longimicrobium sp.]|jgi:hypothetical protein|nr:NACHT domain-containing protein [Longimicrobium sp.]